VQKFLRLPQDEGLGREGTRETGGDKEKGTTGEDK